MDNIHEKEVKKQRQEKGKTIFQTIRQHMSGLTALRRAVEQRFKQDGSISLNTWE